MLFWSANAKDSAPVNDEISQARIRLYRDRGFRFVTVRLDITPLPLHLAYRSYIDGLKGPATIVTALRRLQSDLIPEATFDAASILRDSFQDRLTELDKLETFALSGDSPILVLGLDGMGKTSIVKKAESAIFSHLTALWIDLATTPTPLSLLSALARPLSIQIDPHEAANQPHSLWTDKILPEIRESQKLFIVLDNLQMRSVAGFTRSQATTTIIEQICKDLIEIRKPKNPGVILISSMITPYINDLKTKIHQIEIGQLDRKSMARSLRFHLSRISPLEYDLEKLEILSDELHGYPASIQVIARRVAVQGIDAILSDVKGLKKLKYSIAEELFSLLDISKPELQIIVTIATSKYPMLDRQMRMLFGATPDLVEKIKQYQLLDPLSPGFSIQSILHDYILESMASPEIIKEAHERLTQLFDNEYQKSLPMSADKAQYASVWHYHALSSGKTRWAKLIQTDFLEEAKTAAIELYRRGQYSTALFYLETVKGMGGDVDPIFNFYYGLALNRLGRYNDAKETIGTLIKLFPDVSRYYHAYGTIQKNLSDKEGAIQSFRKAVALASPAGKVTSLCSLAEIITEIGRSEEAIPLIEQALELEPADAFVMAVASQVYDASGQPKLALDIIRDALKTSPSDTRLHHRAGMLLKEIGNYSDAKDHLERATSNPALSFSVTALADVYLELNDIISAEQVLEKYPGPKQRSPSYMATKANILRRKGDYETAEVLLEKAIKIEPNNVVTIGGLANLRIDQVDLAMNKGEKQTALIYLEQAKNAITNGLKIDPKSEILSSLGHNVSKLEIKLKT